MKSKFQNTDLDLSRRGGRSNKPAYSFKSTETASTAGHLQCVTHFTPSDPAIDEPHAVFALGNFFGNGEVFVAIPWQSLQLTKPLKSLNVNVFPTGIVSNKLERTIVASLELKRDSSGCIQVTARKNPD